MNSPFSEATDALMAAAQGVATNDPVSDVRVDTAARYARGEVTKEYADAVEANPAAYVSRFGGEPVQDGPWAHVDLNWATTEDGDRVVRDMRDGHTEVIPF